jgi:hypothetical protein
MDRQSVSDSTAFHNRLSRGRFPSYRFLFLLILLVWGIPLRADTFQNKYLRFSLPHGWHCHLEDSVFVCEPPLPRGHKLPMIIILAAKIANASDTLPGYMDHLRANLSITKGSSLIEGPQINEEIGKVSWVEATHLESELEGYYTTYLATTWDGLSILVTFSAHKSVFPEFRKLIRPCIQSLELKSDWKKVHKGK